MKCKIRHRKLKQQKHERGFNQRREQDELFSACPAEGCQLYPISLLRTPGNFVSLRYRFCIRLLFRAIKELDNQQK